MCVQRSKESDESQGPESERSSARSRPGGHLAGDRTLSVPRSRPDGIEIAQRYLGRGPRENSGPPWVGASDPWQAESGECFGEKEVRGKPPPIGAFRTVRGIYGFVDPDGPQPVHPRACAGDGACLHCLALEHWQKCQILKAQRPAAPAVENASHRRRPPEPREPVAEREPQPGTRRWRRKRRRLLSEGGES